MRIALIACSKSKATGYCQARDLYTGDLFVKSLAYAERVLRADRIYILSAKYHLLALSRWVSPYEETLIGRSVEHRKWWTEQVVKSLKMYGMITDRYPREWHLLAGKNYIEFLAPLLPGTVHTPLAGLGIGEQQKWLKEQLGG